LKMYFVDRLSVRKIAKALGVSHMTVFRMLSDPKVFARVGIR
jgi:DNA-binding transcriptional regulator LsrR (DeoR family)